MPDRRSRILAALGPLGEHFPGVDEETLSRYYGHLAAKLSFPFAAWYPQPTSPLEEKQYRCSVLKLLDPGHGMCDEFDGVFCKTRKGRYEINLPLVELELPENGPNSSSSRTTATGFGIGGETEAVWCFTQSSAGMDTCRSKGG